MSEGSFAGTAVIMLILFSATFTAGWGITAQNPAVGENLMAFFQETIAGQITGENPFETCIRIFINNLEACILLFLGGASFGILTIFITGLNGGVMGAIMEVVCRDHSPAFVAAAILPHGIFEIPAFIIAGTLGLMLARSLAAEWYNGGDAAADAQRSARIFLLYVLPLVALAAGIEAFITPSVIQLVA